MNLILFGFKGCGKTTYGRQLAAALKRKFIDLDEVILYLYEEMTHEKLSCSEIFQKRGEAFFRTLEHHAIVHIKDSKDAVIALGGGSVLYHNNLEIVYSMGQLIYLRASKLLLKKRMLTKNAPAYINMNYPEKSFEFMYKMRSKIYDEIEASVIDIDEKKDEEVITALTGAISGD